MQFLKCQEYIVEDGRTGALRVAVSDTHSCHFDTESSRANDLRNATTRVYPKVSGLATWSENVNGAALCH
jgi:hypothetical protein